MKEKFLSQFNLAWEAWELALRLLFLAGRFSFGIFVNGCESGEELAGFVEKGPPSLSKGRSRFP
jgi:hypothetical protein